MTKKADKDNTFKHWKLSTDIDGILWLSIDRAGESTNSLSTDVLSELGTIVDTLEDNPPKTPAECRIDAHSSSEHAACAHSPTISSTAAIHFLNR